MIRLLSWNVRSLRDDDAALTRLVRRLEPDLLCVQEAPRLLFWRRRCRVLARDSGLRYATGGRTAGAVMLAVGPRVQVHATRDLLLSRAPGLHQRGLALADVTVAGTRLCVATTHLDLEPGERLRHAREVLRSLPNGRPCVLAADVNETLGDPAWQVLAEGLGPAAASGPTFPSRRPRRRIDAVFVDPRLAVRSAEVVDAPEVLVASDHRPLLVVLGRPDGGPHGAPDPLPG